MKDVFSKFSKNRPYNKNNYFVVRKLKKKNVYTELLKKSFIKNFMMLSQIEEIHELKKKCNIINEDYIF